MALTLRAVDISSPSRWRWLLTDENGRRLADHDVDLDEHASEYQAFCDLYGYVRRNRVPDDPVASEVSIVEQVGRWIGSCVFGGAVRHMLAGTVRVELPREAEFLLARPLELAHVAGRPLAASGVTLVYSLTDAATRVRQKEPVGDRLRMLALFSMPVGISPLGLRRERFELVRAVRQVAATADRAIELRVLQYGVTRSRLRESAEEYPGWDLLHVSGPGDRGALLLEGSDGGPDIVSAADLVELLRPARARLKFAVLSANSSGAEVAAETLRLLALDEAAERVALPRHDGAPAVTSSGLARALLEELGVAVLAMRYPVADSFAVALSQDFYPRLLGRHQPVDRALAAGLAEVIERGPSVAQPPLSAATPMLLGPAEDMRLIAPRGVVTLDSSLHRMAAFPDEPRRFVGRAELLAAAGRALAPDTRRAGVLLLGMTGLGKTACALELAYQHRDRFSGLVWWQAPTRPDEFAQALVSFGLALEAQLGMSMVHAVSGDAALRTFLPRLRAALRNNVVLLVLDNVETLLTSARTWRDPAWGPLLETLVGHGGLSRVVLTSRVLPPDVDVERMLVCPVHALSLAESMALALELPNLSRLLHGSSPADRSPPWAQVSADRQLVRQVLGVVQGHPKLLELADAAAAAPHRLQQALAAAIEQDDQLEAFFSAGHSDLNSDQLLHALTVWTYAATSDLPASAGLLIDLLSCMEEADRRAEVLERVWSAFREQDERAWAPFAEALEPLRDAALVEVPAKAGEDPGRLVLGMHAGVAEAIRARVTREFRTLVDKILADFWSELAVWAVNDSEDGGPSGGLVVWAALAAAPYLIRGRRWDEVARLLNEAARRETSPVVTRRVLGYLDRVREAEPNAAHERLYASLLARVDPPAAQLGLRKIVDDALAAGQLDLASLAVGDLVGLLASRGDLAAALGLVMEKAALDRRAQLGPWIGAYDESMRLRILAEMGRHAEVLEHASALLAHLDALPPPQPTERVSEWHVRESTLRTARSAARALHDWPLALEFSAAIQRSQESRGASLYDQAMTRFDDYGPLLRLNRFDDAEQLLLACQQAFEDAGDLDDLGVVFNARADLEQQRGHLDQALALYQVALRYKYQQPAPQALAVTHHNLAGALFADGAQPGVIGAHRLAAALLYRATGRDAHYAGTVRSAAVDLQRLGPELFPADLVQLSEQLRAVSGVRFDDVLADLVPDARARADLLAEVIDAVRRTPVDDPVEPHLRQWDPVIPVVAAAAAGDRQAAEVLQPLLTQLDGSDDWTALGAALRAIIAGERDPTRLQRLDAIDTAIVTAVLDRVDR